MFLLSTSTDSQENIWRMFKGIVVWLSSCLERSHYIFIWIPNVHLGSIDICPKKDHSILERLISCRLKTTHLDVSHELNHKKAMIHITLQWFSNDFQNPVMRHPKVKFGAKKHLRGRTELLWKESKTVAQNHIHKSYFSHSFNIRRTSIDFDHPKMEKSWFFLKKWFFRNSEFT